MHTVADWRQWLSVRVVAGTKQTSVRRPGSAASARHERPKRLYHIRGQHLRLRAGRLRLDASALTSLGLLALRERGSDFSLLVLFLDLHNDGREDSAHTMSLTLLRHLHV